MSDPKICLLIAKPGLDRHDRGAMAVAVHLHDAWVDAAEQGAP